MDKDFNQVWKALCELGDHFSRLGGAAGYFNMSESEIPLYIASCLLERYAPSFEKKEFIDERFLDAASPVIDKADVYIETVEAKGVALATLIGEFIQYADSKLKSQDRSKQWDRFVNMADDMLTSKNTKPTKLTIDEVLTEAQKNERVCPQPQKWQQLYDMLPQKQRKGAGWEPSLPLILAAWWDTPAVLKIARLREHIEWAAKHGCLVEVHSFLCELPENQWHHFND